VQAISLKATLRLLLYCIATGREGIFLQATLRYQSMGPPNVKSSLQATDSTVARPGDLSLQLGLGGPPATARLAAGGKVIFVPPCLFCMEIGESLLKHFRKYTGTRESDCPGRGYKAR
jgi:hypothetical protein